MITAETNPRNEFCAQAEQFLAGLSQELWGDWELEWYLSAWGEIRTFERYADVSNIRVTVRFNWVDSSPEEDCEKEGSIFLTVGREVDEGVYREAWRLYEKVKEPAGMKECFSNSLAQLLGAIANTKKEPRR